MNDNGNVNDFNTSREWEYCPCCARKMQKEWEYCPFCGCTLSEPQTYLSASDVQEVAPNSILREENEKTTQQTSLEVPIDIDTAKGTTVIVWESQNGKNSLLLTHENMTKLRGSLYGFVVGDAIGVPIEFSGRRYNYFVDSMRGYGTHHVLPGTWSDDTSMTLATLDSLAEKRCLVLNDIMDKFCAWYKSSAYTNNGRVFDVGFSTRRALDKYLAGEEEAVECGMKDERSNGNGSLMRVMPVAFYLYPSDYNDEDACVEAVNKVSSLTHAHAISRLGCYIYVRYLMELLKGKDKFEAYEEICNHSYEEYFTASSIEKYVRILNKTLPDLPVDEITSSGYVVSSLEAALWSVLTTENFKDSIVKAINLGNDTDTIGAIAGSMSGIIYGYENIPAEWIETVYGKEMIEDILKKFCH